MEIADPVVNLAWAFSWEVFRILTSLIESGTSLNETVEIFLCNSGALSSCEVAMEIFLLADFSPDVEDVSRDASRSSLTLSSALYYHRRE